MPQVNPLLVLLLGSAALAVNTWLRRPRGVQEPVFDLLLLSQRYARRVADSLPVSWAQWNRAIVPVLQGKPVGKDEFERHAFRENLAMLRREIGGPIYQLDRPVKVCLSSYDFELHRFAVAVDFPASQGSRGHDAVPSQCLYPEEMSQQMKQAGAHSSCRLHYVEIESTAVAQQWKACVQIPPGLRAKILVKCFRDARGRDEQSPARWAETGFQLMGLRLYDALSGAAWLPPAVILDPGVSPQPGS